MQSKYNNLIELFEEIVRQHPDRPAIKDCHRSFTYRELRRRAAGVAALLLSRGVRAGDNVVCISKKNTESLICFWGILLSGGVPVLLDHDDGAETNGKKVKVVRAGVVILDQEEGRLPAGFEGCTLIGFADLAGDGPDAARTGDGAAPAVVPEACYILLTSGTTGLPKAVQISHRNLLHYTEALYERIGRPARVNAAHVTTFAADLGLTSFCAALISGGMLRIFNKAEATDPARFSQVLADDAISLLKITPSHLRALVSGRHAPAGRPLHTLVLGGEKLSWPTVQEIFDLNLCENLYNHYGPTETTIGAAVFKVDRASVHFNQTASAPIGSPLGEGVLFLNEEADGVGELYIAGPGVSLGYFGNAQENAKRFVAARHAGSPVHCFRTGDFCRRLGDGN
ncbi:MAG TPA: AMP-binding protein, partial [Cytophagales bacterium]